MLQTPELKQSQIDTVAFSNPATAPHIRLTEEMNLYAPPAPEPAPAAAPVPPPVQHPEPPSMPTAVPPWETNKNGAPARLWLTVGPVLLAVAAAAFGGWYYFKNQEKRPAQSENLAVVSTPAAAPSPSAEPSKPATKGGWTESDSPANAGSEDAKKEIAALVESWRKAAEARKVTDYLGHYADKIDYFDKETATPADVRAEMQKVFDKYKSVEVTLTDVRVAVNADDTAATAVFDKEWSYETDKDLSEGKAHTRLQFEKKGTEWKIVGETYQRVYYMEN